MHASLTLLLRRSHVSDISRNIDLISSLMRHGGDSRCWLDTTEVLGHKITPASLNQQLCFIENTSC